MDNIIQFILAYNNTINISCYYNEICTKIYTEPDCNKNDVLFAIIDVLVINHNSVNILTYNNVIPLLEYIIKQLRLNGVIMLNSGITLSDMYKPIVPTLYPDSEFAKHVNRYIESVSISNNMMSLFNIKPSPQKNIPITIDELLQRVERLENEVRELKSKI